MSGILKRHDKVNERNVSKQEWQAIDQLKRDDTIMILPADKGRVTVVMKKSEYQEKCEKLLNDEKTYKKLKGDPTRKYKIELGNVLRDLKERKIITPNYTESYTPQLTSPHVSTASRKYTRTTPPFARLLALLERLRTSVQSTWLMCCHR